MPLDNLPKDPEQAREWLHFFKDYPIVGVFGGALVGYYSAVKGWLPVGGYESCKTENRLMRAELAEVKLDLKKFKDEREEHFRKLDEEVRELRNKNK